MNTKPFPWNPHGFIRQSVAHLFRIKQDNHRNVLPPGHPRMTPAPASHFTIGKSNPARTAQISKARI